MTVIFVTLILILLTNWFFSQALLFIPIDLLNGLDSFSSWMVLGIVLLMVAWCFGDGK